MSGDLISRAAAAGTAAAGASKAYADQTDAILDLMDKQDREIAHLEHRSSGLATQVIHQSAVTRVKSTLLGRVHQKRTEKAGAAALVKAEQAAAKVLKSTKVQLKTIATVVAKHGHQKLKGDVKIVIGHLKHAKATIVTQAAQIKQLIADLAAAGETITRLAAANAALTKENAELRAGLGSATKQLEAIQERDAAVADRLLAARAARAK